MDLHKKVKESFRWKKGAKYCSKRLNISLDTYIKIRKEIKKSF